jgi:hypothetical protein
MACVRSVTLLMTPRAGVRVGWTGEGARLSIDYSFIIFNTTFI